MVEKKQKGNKSKVGKKSNTVIMGCTESMPEKSSFNVPHEIDPVFVPIGLDAGAGPSTSEPCILYVKEKFFSWSGDDFSIKTQGGGILGNGLKVKGKAFAFRDQMALVDGNKKLVGVCLRKFQLMGQTFKVYVPNPVLKGQKPSANDYNGQKLYGYCEVERVPFDMTQNVFFEGRKSSPAFRIKRVGSLFPKKRLVTRKGKPAALMEGGTWEGNYNTYKITSNPGIDQCLMILLCAICDEMDEQK